MEMLLEKGKEHLASRENRADPAHMLCTEKKPGILVSGVGSCCEWYHMHLLCYTLSSLQAAHGCNLTSMPCFQSCHQSCTPGWPA